MYSIWMIIKSHSSIVPKNVNCSKCKRKIEVCYVHTLYTLVIS